MWVMMESCISPNNTSTSTSTSTPNTLSVYETCNLLRESNASKSNWKESMSLLGFCFQISRMAHVQDKRARNIARGSCISSKRIFGNIGRPIQI